MRDNTFAHRYCYNSVDINRVGRAALAMPPTRDTTKARFVMPGDPTPFPEVAQAKTCTKCGETKALAEFYRDYRVKGHNGYLARCKSCKRIADQRKRAEDGDVVRAAERARWPRRKAGEQARRATPEFRQWKREYERARRQRMGEAYRAECRRRYAAAPHKWKAASRLRHARIRGAAGKASNRAVLWRWEFYGGMCWMCGATATQTDHVIPIARGGSNWPANLRPICGPCNHFKYAKSWREVCH